MKKLLQFTGWPILSGVLIALVMFQYQQISQLSSEVRQLASAVDLLRRSH